MSVYTTQVILPYQVKAYFAALAQHGQVTYSSGGTKTKVTVSTDDLYTLRGVVADIEALLSPLSGSPLTPIERPSAIDGAYVITVPVTDDVREYVEAITGLAGIQFDPNNPDERATVTFECEDEYDLAMLVTEINETMRSIGINYGTLDDRPTLVA